MKQRIVLLISGRGSNMEAILQNSRSGILKDHCEIVAVIANRSQAAGLQIASDYGVQTYTIPSKGKTREVFEADLIKQIDLLEVDLIVLAGFMRILTPAFTQNYPKKIINIHPADTSEHQGVDGYAWAWEKGLEESAITVHYVDEGLDTGQVIGKCKVDLRGAKSLEDVEKLGLRAEHVFYSQMLCSVLKETQKAESLINFDGP